MTNVILRCTNLYKSFSLDKKGPSALHVLKGIDLDVQEGEVVSIVGASGSGKSTLLHILGGLDRPSRGEVFWGETNILTLTDETLAKRRGTNVGFVFQFHHLLPEFTSIENVMIPMMIHGRSMDEAEPRARELLEKVGLSERLNHKPGELSGGEQQRVAVARALANNPKIIFADEPTGNLDSLNSEQLHELLWELNNAEKQTFVIVTHNEQFTKSSHRVFRMVDGKLQKV
ncbi:MAG: ABC transporter ATP-binding protein [Ignavibacteriales bacterium]|nr:ABC transporter ATP-binding protein [Ignavibacteriales bacterium]